MSRSAAVRKAAPEAGRRGRPGRSHQTKGARTTEATITAAPGRASDDKTEAAAVASTPGVTEPAADGPPTEGPALTLVPPPAAEPAPADSAATSTDVPAATEPAAMAAAEPEPVSGPAASVSAASVSAASVPAASVPAASDSAASVPAAEESKEEAIAEGQPTAPEAAALDVAEEAAVERALPDEDDTPSPVNYDEEGIGEVEIDGNIYRFDSGKQGTALCLSRRQEGAWRWSYLGELRWDGRDLRSKSLERSLLMRLSASLRALAEAAN